MAKEMWVEDTLRFTFHHADEGEVSAVSLMADFPSDVQQLRVGDVVPLRVVQVEYKGRVEAANRPPG